MMSKFDDMINVDKKNTCKNISFFYYLVLVRVLLDKKCYFDIYYLLSYFMKGYWKKMSIFIIEIN